MDVLTPENLPVLLADFLERSGVSVNACARALTCSESTLRRLLDSQTLATEYALKQVHIMMVMGHDRFCTLSRAERESISEKVGTTGGSLLGLGAISGTVSSLGVTGLSASGITSGLASLGGLVGGGMIAGVVLASTIPLAGAVAGYGVVKLTKHLILTHRLNDTDINPTWETGRTANA